MDERIGFGLYQSSGDRVSVSSCRCCMFVSCVHPVAVLKTSLVLYLIFIRVSYSHYNHLVFLSILSVLLF